MEEESFETPLFERTVMVTAWRREERQAIACLCWDPFRVNFSPVGVDLSPLVVAIFPPQDELLSVLGAEEGKGRQCWLRR